MHPNSLANLKPWKPGQSGNPKGRPPKVRTIPDILRRLGQERVKDGEQTRLEAVLRKVYDLALEGQAWAVQFIAERTEGKAPERLQAQVSMDQPLVVPKALVAVDGGGAAKKSA